MDPVLSDAMKDRSFGSTWRPGMGREGDDRPKTGRRSFLGRGAAAVAAGVAAFSAPRSGPAAIRTICPACTRTRMCSSSRRSRRTRTPT